MKIMTGTMMRSSVSPMIIRIAEHVGLNSEMQRSLSDHTPVMGTIDTENGGGSRGSLRLPLGDLMLFSDVLIR